MACEITSKGPVVFVMWGTPEIPDLARILREVSTVEQRFGPVVFVARVPVDADPPQGDVRDVLGDKMHDLVDRCDSYHVILEGEGFAATIKRSVLSGLMMLSRAKKRVFVHARHEQVLRAVAPQQRSWVLAAFRSILPLGLLSDRVADRPWLDPKRQVQTAAR